MERVEGALFGEETMFTEHNFIQKHKETQTQTQKPTLEMPPKPSRLPILLGITITPLLNLSDRASAHSILGSLLCSLSDQVVGAVRLIKRVDDGAGELSSGDLLCEQDVELVVCPVPGLGEAEVGPDEHAEASAAPDESSVALKVPGLRVHHELLQSAADETGDIGAVASKADGLLSQSCRSLE
jgi:hypothetical protein